MDAHADLWGEITPIVVRTPAAILREQASLLGSKTKNTIEGKVDSRVSGSMLYHAFSLVVPALDNYTYELFQVSHDANLYPVHVGFPFTLDLEGEEAFVKWLGQKLSSAETKGIISNLLAQANS